MQAENLGLTSPAVSFLKILTTSRKPIKVSDDGGSMAQMDAARSNDERGAADSSPPENLGALRLEGPGHTEGRWLLEPSETLMKLIWAGDSERPFLAPLIPPPEYGYPDRFGLVFAGYVAAQRCSGEKVITVSLTENGILTAPLQDGFCQSFHLKPEKATAIFSRIVEEVRDAARKTYAHEGKEYPLGGGSYYLSVDGDGEILCHIKEG